jgi:hypothetical protein
MTRSAMGPRPGLEGYCREREKTILVPADTRGLGVVFGPPLRYRRGSVQEVRGNSALSRDGNGAEGF